MPTKIEWTDETWNVVVGCTKCGIGCENCYAERMAVRLSAMGQEKYQRVITAKAHSRRGEQKWTGGIFCDKKVLNKPLHWKKPRRIFVVSMGDLFHEKVPFEFIKQVRNIAIKCPQHTLQFLTKRVSQMLRFTQWLAGHDDISIAEWPRNCWLGVSISTQAEADEKIPILLQIPAAVRFVSYEPLLERILVPFYLESKGIGWGIVGCESINGKAGRFQDGFVEAA
ncbi:unnamed protein product, partial [marine sediment metagenome]